MDSTLNTTELMRRMDDPHLTLIDVRPADAYNGWRLHRELRGGHIRGAKCLPAKWTNYIDWPDTLRIKTQDTDQPVVVYGYTTDEAEIVANRFRRAHYTQVATYHDFVDEWASNERLPMDSLPRYRQLVPATWLDQLLQTAQAPEMENDKYVVCHAFYEDRSPYEEGHIPGAIALDTNSLESPETWNLRSPEELKQTLEELGITHDTTVVLYGRFSFPDNNDPHPGSSAGHLGSIRCAFAMLVAGVKDVRILNGGLRSWLDEGFETTQEESKPKPVADFGAEIPAHPELVVDTPQAKEILAADNANLVSVRSWPEFIGDVSGYHYIEKRGRIPGAVFANCGSDAYHMENYRNLDHTMREYHEIERAWKEVGITPDKQNAFYCGTGWRGSEAFMAAWFMGWPSIALYDGGWFEWSNDESNPYETGEPQ